MNIDTLKVEQTILTSPGESNQAESCELGKQQAGGSVVYLELYMHAPQAPKALPGRKLRENFDGISLKDVLVHTEMISLANSAEKLFRIFSHTQLIRIETLPIWKKKGKIEF